MTYLVIVRKSEIEAPEDIIQGRFKTKKSAKREMKILENQGYTTFRLEKVV